jgi:N-formylglutamate amidohydrolase
MSKEILPILIVAAHTSFFVPKTILKEMLLSPRDIKKEADLYTDEIFKVGGVHFLRGHVSRLVTDLNRAPDHIEMEHMLAHDGVVVSVNENCEQIYKTPPSIEQIHKRIVKYHDPFHAQIDALKPEVKFIIDGHSLLSQGPATKDDAGKKRADIVLGNRDYTTCSRVITMKIADFFKKRGFSVKINDPYGGKYIIGHHCSRVGVNGIQIEVNKGLYMNEKTLRPYKRKIKVMNQHITELVDFLSRDILSANL